jgi:hypothetical protein
VSTDRMSPEIIAEARTLYADRNVPVPVIAAKLGISRHAVYYAVNGAGGTLPPLPRRRADARRTPSGHRLLLVQRLWRTAERQVREIEQRLLRNDYAAGERGEDAHVLAVVVKTLRELAALENPDTGKPKDKDTTDDDDGPRDIDEFRRELARRMHAFVASRTGGSVSGA